MTDPLLKFKKMLVTMVWQILLLCIFRVSVAENAALQDCSLSGTVKCFCGEEPSYEVKSLRIQNSKAGEEECSEILSAVCAIHSCSYRPEYDASEDDTKRENHVSAKKRSLNPVKIVLPPLDDESEDSRSKLRHRRFPKTCNDSILPVRHAVLECSVWPEFINCEVNCTHGYATMEDGKAVLQTTRKCRESESTWQPKAYFPVCEPYINCKAILIKPGDLDCKTSGPMISYCDISCEADEDKDEVPKKRYECLDENFAKTLPHCAMIAKDVNLIPRPHTSRGPQKAPHGPQKAPQRTPKAHRRP